jgi:hypothetical protein
MKKIMFSNYCTPAYLNIALGVAIIIGTFLAGVEKETLAAEAAFIVKVLKSYLGRWQLCRLFLHCTWVY